MSTSYETIELLQQQNHQLRHELRQAQDTLDAIRQGEVDALLLEGGTGDEVYILKGADHIYRVLVEEMQESYVTLTIDGTILFCNKNFARITKTSPDKIIGSSIYAFLNSEDQKYLTWFLSESKENFKLECRLKTYDGCYIPTLISANIITIGPDTFTCIVFTDISNQRRTERFIRIVFDQAKEAIIVCDRLGCIVQANPAAIKLFGVNLIGSDFDTVIPLFNEYDNTRFFLNHITNLVAMCGVEVYYMLSQGEVLNLLLNFGQLSDEEADSILGYVITITDITENRKFARELIRLEQLSLVGEMAAGIGHEVRNPMTTVRGYLQLFREKTQFTRYREDFDVMIGELDRANDIISEFLSLAKNKAVKLQPTNLKTVIENIYPLIQADAFSRNCTIELDLANIPPVLADEKEIRQCLLNLVRNGFEAMPKGGAITIRTFKEGERIKLAVQDRGTGIPVHIRDKLGTPFLTTKEHGTGLGLPVCYSIAERHRARITVDTSARGTTFYVVFNPEAAC